MFTFNKKTEEKIFYTANLNKNVRTRRSVLFMAALALAALCGPITGTARAEPPDPPPGKLGGGNK